MRSLSHVMSECSLSGRGQGHVSNFYIVDFKKFRQSKSSAWRWYTQLDRRRFVYDTYKTMKVTRMRHGWVHMFITHRPTLTLQLHNVDLFRTSRTSSFCTVAWQLARFQLTRRIARSLGDSWASWTEARDGEWQWHQLSRMQVCTSLQTDNHASTPPLTTQFLQAGRCPSCRLTNSVKALKTSRTISQVIS